MLQANMGGNMQSLGATVQLCIRKANLGKSHNNEENDCNPTNIQGREGR